VKPLDTFARESVQLITGRVYFQGKDPLETLLGWIADPESASHQPLILSRHQILNERLQLSVQEGRISYEALLGNGEFKRFLQGISLKQQEGASLSSVEKEATSLFDRLGLFSKIVTGSALALFPAGNSEAWASLETSPGAAGFKKVVEDFKAKDAQTLQGDAKALRETLRHEGSAVANYPSEKIIDLEVFFNKARPFQKAWILFLASFFVLLFSMGVQGRWPYRAGVGLAATGILVSAFGFACRCVLAGRPPVTNMYESVIWVSFGAVVFALIFEAIYRSRYFLLSGTAGASIGLLLADFLPNVLSPNIQPLVPVLRSNFWLTIHVLTITLSYAAFLLATGVAHASIGFYAFKPQETEKIRRLNFFLYRSLQVGVVLLAAGTILGGVWANYSWGRFWGWDPKEVWALIALLGYVAILHGRLIGWLTGFRLAAACVAAFLLVLMAWYGVNFILGVGLHSYGF